MRRLFVLIAVLGLLPPQVVRATDGIRVGTFDVDASPPIGSPLAYDPTKGVETPLTCRGIVLAGAGEPIVLCSVDWIGISNGGQTEFRKGLARNARQQETGVPHIHFNGAGGDIGAGKWNDGSKENRQVLADRVAAGMRGAWENTKKSPLSAEGVGWTVEPVVLPASEHMDEAALMRTVEDENAKPDDRWYAAKNLTWLRRCQSGDPIDIACLRLNTARVLHMPGELLIDYQLAAQKLRPDLFVAVAAYGEYAPGYIATEIAYTQGGYEASPRASKVAPAVEGVLMGAIGKLLGAPE